MAQKKNSDPSPAEERTEISPTSKSLSLDVKTVHSVDERRVLVNHLLGTIFELEMSQFLKDGVFGHKGTLLARAKAKLLSFPPIRKSKTAFEISLDKVLTELPDLIQSYSKATGKDFNKKIKKVVCGNLTLALVQDHAVVIPLSLMSNEDSAVAESDDEHNYFQKKLLALFGLFLSGVERDGGIDVLMDRIRAYHSISELPEVYQLCFAGLRQYMRHSFAQIATDKKKRKTIQRVMTILPQSAIIAVLRLNSGSKMMNGFSSLFLAKIGGQSLFQRVIAQRMDVNGVEAERDALANKIRDRRLVPLIMDYIKERYPIEGGWKAFSDRKKVVAAMHAQVNRNYDGMHQRHSETIVTQNHSAQKPKRSIKQIFKPKDGNVGHESCVQGEMNSGGMVDEMYRLSVAGDESLLRGRSGRISPSSQRSKSNSSTNSNSYVYDITNNEIDTIDDWTCGAIFQVASKELERLDLLTLVQFSGSEAVADFLAGLLKSLGSPLSDISRSGGMADLAAAMFAMVGKSLEVFQNTTTSVEKKMIELDFVLKEFMNHFYTFLHNATVLDHGNLHETIEWLLESYVHSAEEIDLDELLEVIEDPMERELVWKEMETLNEYRRRKKSRSSGTATSPVASSTSTATTTTTSTSATISKPMLVVSDRLVPAMQAQLSQRLTGRMNGNEKEIFNTSENRNDLLSSASLMCGINMDDAVVHQSNMNANFLKEGDEIVVSHLAVCYDQRGTYALEKHGFSMCNDEQNVRKPKNIYVMCKKTKMMQNSILPIVELTVSVSKSDDTKLRLAGYIRVAKDLSKGTLFGNKINLWYKRGDIEEARSAISNIKVLLAGQTPSDETYKCINVDINKNTLLGKPAFVWYRRIVPRITEE
eukprot:CFRG7905T1